MAGLDLEAVRQRYQDAIEYDLWATVAASLADIEPLVTAVEAYQAADYEALATNAEFVNLRAMARAVALACEQSLDCRDCQPPCTDHRELLGNLLKAFYEAADPWPAREVADA